MKVFLAKSNRANKATVASVREQLASAGMEVLESNSGAYDFKKVLEADYLVIVPEKSHETVASGRKIYKFGTGLYQEYLNFTNKMSPKYPIKAKENVIIVNEDLTYTHIMEVYEKSLHTATNNFRATAYSNCKENEVQQPLEKFIVKVVKENTIVFDIETNGLLGNMNTLKSNQMICKVADNILSGNYGIGNAAGSVCVASSAMDATSGWCNEKIITGNYNGFVGKLNIIDTMTASDELLRNDKAKEKEKEKTLMIILGGNFVI